MTQGHRATRARLALNYPYSPSTGLCATLGLHLPQGGVSVYLYTHLAPLARWFLGPVLEVPLVQTLE